MIGTRHNHAQAPSTRERAILRWGEGLLLPVIGVV